MKLRHFAAAAALAAAATMSAADAASPAAVPTQASAVVAPPVTPRARTSPHEVVGLRADENRITIVYGRPYSKDPKTGQVRRIWGALVPAGKVWRMGADEATVLMTQKPVTIGGAKIPAGASSLYFLLAADGSAQLLVNRLVGQWGADAYDSSGEIARIPLVRETLSSPVDQFTIALERDTPTGAWLKLAWENTQYSARIEVAR